MNDTNAGAGAGESAAATTTEFDSRGFPIVKEEAGANGENDNSSASSTDKTNTDQTQSQDGDQKSGADKKDDGDAGFADHPRWKEREADWTKRFNDQEQRHVDEIAKLREEFLGKATAKPAEAQAEAGAGDATPEQPPAWFGGDAEAWKSFREWNNKELSAAEERGAQRALKEISSKSEAEQKAIQDATNYFNEEVSSIESDKELNPDGLKVDRNKLLKTALDNDLIDSKGRWNYKAAFKLMKPSEVFQAKAAMDEKKRIAGASTDDKRTESKPDAVATSETFKKDRPW